MSNYTRYGRAALVLVASIVVIILSKDLRSDLQIPAITLAGFVGGSACGFMFGAARAERYSRPRRAR